MRRVSRALLALVMLCTISVALGQEAANSYVPDQPWESIDVAILFDTSGSMQKLLDAARLKLWEIVNDLALAEPTPRVRVAILTYGHTPRGPEDGWVRIWAPLTEDLDLVSQRLFEARIQGDKEYVARALDAALQDLEWTESDESLRLAAKELSAPSKAFDSEALDVLRAFDWPGNVRQIVNAARRLTVTAPGSVITAQDIPADLGGTESSRRATKEWTRSLAAWAETQVGEGGQPLVASALPEFEKTLIQIAMSQTNGHRQEAAKLLGWGRNTLARKMKALHLD